MPARLLPESELRAQYYLNLDVTDRPGVLAAVAKVFGDHGVSIRSMEQEGRGEARLVFLTHSAPRATSGRPSTAWRGSTSSTMSAACCGSWERTDDGEARIGAWRGVIEEYREFLPVTAPRRW